MVESWINFNGMLTLRVLFYAMNFFIYLYLHFLSIFFLVFVGFFFAHSYELWNRSWCNSYQLLKRRDDTLCIEWTILFEYEH